MNTLLLVALPLLVHFAVHDITSYHNIATIIKWPVHVEILHTFNSSNFLIMEVATIAITIKVNSGAVPVRGIRN